MEVPKCVHKTPKLFIETAASGESAPQIDF